MAACHHTPTGLLVSCYHDGTICEAELVCEDCAPRLEHKPAYEWEREVYYSPVGRERAEKVIRLMKTGEYYLSEALDASLTPR